MIAFLTPYILALLIGLAGGTIGGLITVIVRSISIRRRINERVQDLMLERRAIHGL